VLFTQVADETDDVLGDQAPDGAAGVHADHDPAAGVEHEPGRLQEQRIIVDERAGRIGDRRSVGAVPHQEPQAVLVDELPRGGLIVHRQRHDRDIHLGEAVQRLLERAELGVAVRAPGASVEDHDGRAAGACRLEGRRPALDVEEVAVGHGGADGADAVGQPGGVETGPQPVMGRRRRHGFRAAHPGQGMGDVGQRAQLGAETAQRFDRNSGREIRRQLFAGGGFDRRKHVRRTSAVVAARQAIRIRRKSRAGQRLGEDRAHNRFAVYKYAIAIEDDHGSLRCVDHADWPPFKLFKLSTATIANGRGMQRPSQHCETSYAQKLRSGREFCTTAS